MEKFFKPVHSPCVPDEIKPRKHHHHYQNPRSHRYTTFDDTDRNTDESHGHHHHPQHGRYIHDSPHLSAHHHHQTQQFHPSEENEILYNHPTAVTLSAVSSSSLSSSSSSSLSSSWCTEESANDPFLHRHAERPQHSLSCSNIPEVRRRCRVDNIRDPIVLSTIKHEQKGSVCSEKHGSTQQRRTRGFSSLDRGLSRSDEGLQGEDSDLGGARPSIPHMNYGPLYKTASLNRGLAIHDEETMLRVSRGPKRAVSSSQLPSKGILKNKNPENDIRKAKSLEVLSPRVAKGQDSSGQKGKGATQVEIEQARANFVQGKLQFSAFLDEITKQVISPSHLTSLGMKNNQTTEKTSVQPPQTPVRPQLPPKNRKSSKQESEQHPKQPSRHEKAACSSPRKHSDCSISDKLITYTARNHHSSPPPHNFPHTASHSHHGSNRKDKRPLSSGGSVSEDRYSRYGSHLTDGTSTSPEPSHPKQRHHHKQQSTVSHSTHTQRFYQHPPPQVHRGPSSSSLSIAQSAGPGLGSESSSSKSDSSRFRDTASTATSHSSELSGQHHLQHSEHSKQRRDTLCDADHLHALQEENADLHQNLLQTVVCIESLEAELQRTRDELSHVKEKYKSLLETHTGTKQANNLLGEHLHIASESLSSERKYLLNRVSQLSSELEDAHRTIAALENINVPCLIKDLLEKHFDSAEAIQTFLSNSAPISRLTNSPHADSRSPASKVGEAAHDWLTKTGLQRVTAFMPFKPGVPTTGTEACLSVPYESNYSQPFSVADIGTDVSNKMTSSYADRPQSHYTQSQQQPPPGTKHTDCPPNLQQAHLCGDSWGGRGGVTVTLLEQDVVDVTSMSAQQILDDFMQQLQFHKDVGGGKEQQGGQEWAGGAEQTGKEAE